MSSLRQFRKKGGFTLLEILIVITLIVILAIAFLVFFNPKFQIEKSWDGKRKKELNTLQKVFEEYYNDNNCYPKPEEVCYDDPQAVTEDAVTEDYVCHICGREALPPNFSSFKDYLSELPCDPQHPTKDYLYEVDDSACPSLYRIYTRLSNEQDEAISKVGCLAGCAPVGYSVTSETAYNYGVTSPNTSLEMADTKFIQWACKIDYTCEPCCYQSTIDAGECPSGISKVCPDLSMDPDYCQIYSDRIVCLDQCSDSCKNPR